MTHRTEIARHFVDSSALCGSVLEFVGVLKKIGIEWNRTADSRTVLTEGQDISFQMKTCLRRMAH